MSEHQADPSAEQPEPGHRSDDLEAQQGAQTTEEEGSKEAKEEGEADVFSTQKVSRTFQKPN